jgi:xanthine/uracil permease
LTARQGRRFGLTVGVALVALGGLLWWRDHNLPATVSGALGGLLVLAAITVPRSLGPVERVWMGVARRLSRVMTPVVMGIVYFLVVMPIGLVIRLLGRNPLAITESEGGFWVSRAAEESRRGGMNHQF